MVFLIEFPFSLCEGAVSNPDTRAGKEPLDNFIVISVLCWLIYLYLIYIHS